MVRSLVTRRSGLRVAIGLGEFATMPSADDFDRELVLPRLTPR